MPLILRVQILEARNLAAKDANGYSDPFVVLEFGKQKAKTSIIKKNLNPVWDQEFSFDLPIPPPLSLKLTVWDHDVMRPNDFLGVCYYPLDTILTTTVPNTPLEQLNRSEIPWIPLVQRSSKSCVTGDIHVRAGVMGDPAEIEALRKSLSLTGLLRPASTMTFDPIGSGLSSSANASAVFGGDESPTLGGVSKASSVGGHGSSPVPIVTLSRFGSSDATKDLDGVLTLDILGANNLPALRAAVAGFDMDPFCVVTLGDRCHRTRTKKHSLNPEWDERVVLPVTKLAAAQWPVTLSVYDQDRFTANDFVGCAEVPLAELIPMAAAAAKGGAGATGLVDLTLPLTVSTEHATVMRVPASIHIRATWRDMATVRASLWHKLVRVLATATTLPAAAAATNGSNKPHAAADLAHATDALTLTDGDDAHVPFESLVTMLESLGHAPDPSGGAADDLDPILDQAYASINKPANSDLSVDDAVRLCDALFKIHDHDHTLLSLEKCPNCQIGFMAEADVIPHLDVCLDARKGGAGSGGGFMMGGFVTETHSSRKGLTKLVNKLTRGEYSIGGDSANILVANRDNGQLIEEKIPTFVRLGIRMLYRASATPVNTPRVKAMLEKMSVKQGIKYTDPKSKAEIPKFTKYHNLNTDEILEPLDSFANFNEFFYRKLKPDARPLASPYPEVAVSAADCRLMAFPTIADAQELWIKGRNFTLARLLDSSTEAERFVGGSLLIFRLAPQDYHRFHIPVDGTLSETHAISGAYYTVNPMAIRSTIDVYLDNKRAVTYIDSPQFGRVAFVAIGAMMVGSIVQTTVAGQQVKRGDEQGYFAFGGSTIVCLFEPSRLELDQDLVANSRRKVETLVRVGMSIGRVPGFKAPSPAQ